MSSTFCQGFILLAAPASHHTIHASVSVSIIRTFSKVFLAPQISHRTSSDYSNLCNLRNLWIKFPP